MKAYIVGLHSDTDVGNQIVFAKTAKEARKLVDLDIAQCAESYIDVYVRRYPDYDGLENLSEDEMLLLQWRDGWRWFDRDDQPDCETATDKEFLEWLKN